MQRFFCVSPRPRKKLNRNRIVLYVLFSNLRFSLKWHLSQSFPSALVAGQEGILVLWTREGWLERPRNSCKAPRCQDGASHHPRPVCSLLRPLNCVPLVLKLLRPWKLSSV